MSDFQDVNWDRIFPNYLSASTKDRLKDALNQFRPEHRGNAFSYHDFYINQPSTFFRQADLIYEIKFPIWDDETGAYTKGYTDCIILSNTCDISADNKRSVNSKQCLMAPLVDLSIQLDVFKNNGCKEVEIVSFLADLRSQLLTNMFYIPATPSNNKEYIALLDQAFWIKTEELNNLIESIAEDKIASLNHYGYYLFILKLCYHLCRLPEEEDRAA